jgi:hypothetical protein
MAILTQDIKLLKSAVMADTSDGGGAMTGTQVVDGQSNNLFPDTSALDRAFGRVNLRKVFGVAHTLDTDTLLGAHAIITDAPDDPLVHCSLIKTSGWSDQRALAKEAIEKYLVKGPKATVRLYDTHYAGSLQIRLISFVSAPFPSAGDAIVLRTTTGAEQYLRLLTVKIAKQNIAVTEGGAILVLEAEVATCELGQPLDLDFFGPPAARTVNEALYAQIFTTVDSGGAKFYGIKPLAIAGAPGDMKVTTAGGIYTPVVPAATIETALIDQYPMQPISQLTFTAATSITLDSAVVTIAPNRSINFPTAIKPGTVQVLAGGLTFTDDAQGNLTEGGRTVGSVDYKLGIATVASGAAYNFTVTASASYTPASLVAASTNSQELQITTANQGLSYTNVFEPLPSPGSFTLAYMAQGRWYELADNANGKLAGADPAYGIGNINYTTGSMAVTLGAVPDVGSFLIASWGSQAAAVKVETVDLPPKANVVIELTKNAKDGDITLAWVNGMTPYTASAGADGIITGAATGYNAKRKVFFEPNVFPTGDITVGYRYFATDYLSTEAGDVTLTGSAGAWQITSSLPIIPGSLYFILSVAAPAPPADGSFVSFLLDTVIGAFDRSGKIFVSLSDGGNVPIEIGTINYTTGAIALASSFTTRTRKRPNPVLQSGWTIENLRQYQAADQIVAVSLSLAGQILSLRYSRVTSQAATIVYTPTVWSAAVDTFGSEFGADALTFSLGNQKYSVKDGNIVQNWNFGSATGNTLVAGSVSGSGLLSINPANLPPNRVNTLVFANATLRRDPGLVNAGVFRILSAPVKTGVFQLQVGALVGTANDAGVISGGGFTGTVDYTRGIVRWKSATFIDPKLLSYNAVLLQYLPLEAGLLGLETARLPLDGKVPVFRKAELLVVHNTLTTALPNPLVKNTAYSLGRVRLASVRVKDAAGVLVPDTLYTAALDPGTLTVPTAANITGYAQPFTVEHRIEDMVLCSQTDISGQLKITRSLTHAFPAGTSFVSSAMPFGDLFARAYNFIDQSTWTGVWSDVLIGTQPLASYNYASYPVAMTNKGAIEERWALIFTSTTAFRVVGEFSGEVAVGNINTVTAPTNPAASLPYFTIPVLGWGGGWAAGNVLRFNTEACGAPFWTVRTVLQGPASLESDAFSIAFRGDVDRV